MGKKIVIKFTDTPYKTDYFGLTMSGASASFMIDGPWNGNYLPSVFTKEAATIGLYNYINSNLPVDTDITISKTSDTVNLFSESCNFVRFYKYTSSSSYTLITTGDINHVDNTNTMYVNVSFQDWTSNYIVGSNIINLTWSGASDPEQSIKGYELEYRVGTSTVWLSIPFIQTSNGGASYNFTMSRQVTHEFRVRTVDISNLKSEWKSFKKTIVALFQISQSSVFGSACNLEEPKSPVYINTTNTNPSKDDFVYTDSEYTNAFDGTRTSISGTTGQDSRSWKIKTPSNVYYTCVINASGKITSLSLCTSPYNSARSTNSNISEGSTCTAELIKDVYWEGNNTELSETNLVVGTVLHNSFPITTTSALALGFYRIFYWDSINEKDIHYVINVGPETRGGVEGVVRSIKNFDIACPVKTTTTNTSGGNSGGSYSGGGGCVDPLVSILLPNGTTRFSGELEVGDIILTVHEITKNLGEFKVLKKEIIIQDKVIVKFTDDTEIIVSDSHKFLMVDDTWKQIFDLIGNETVKGLKADKTIKEILKIGEGDVVMLEIEDAHTYISDGLISHNIKQVRQKAQL